MRSISRCWPLLLLAAVACGVSQEDVALTDDAYDDAPDAATDASLRRCGKKTCETVTENCYGGEGKWCVCSTTTCTDRCGTTVQESGPQCVDLPDPRVPQPGRAR